MELQRVAPLVEHDPDRARAALLGRRIGPHVAIRAGLRPAAERARLVGAGAIQVFTDNPTAWTARSEPHEGLEVFRRQLHAWRIDLLVHASYLVNLATPDRTVLDRSIVRMGNELDAARGFGASALNVHIDDVMSPKLQRLARREPRDNERSVIQFSFELVALCRGDDNPHTLTRSVPHLEHELDKIAAS